jgi:hypothetical protein
MSRSLFGPGRELLVGEVLRLHAREGLIDQAMMHVDFDVYRPIGRSRRPSVILSS